MSIKLLNELFQKRSVPAKLRNTLIALCDTAGDEGYCHPTIAYLAWKTESSERTVSRSIKELERLGAVHVKKRYKQSSIYKVDLSALPEKEPWQKSVSEEYAEFEEEILARKNDTRELSPDNLSPDKHDIISDKHDIISDKHDGELTPDGVQNRHGTVMEPSGNRFSPPAKADVAPDSSSPDKKERKKNPPKPGERKAEWGNRNNQEVWDIVVAYCEGLGIDAKDLTARQRPHYVRAAQSTPAKWSPDHVKRCTMYMATDTWQRERGIPLGKVVDRLADWHAMGEPDSTVTGAQQARRWKASQSTGPSADDLRRAAQQLREQGK